MNVYFGALIRVRPRRRVTGHQTYWSNLFGPRLVLGGFLLFLWTMSHLRRLSSGDGMRIFPEPKNPPAVAGLIDLGRGHRLLRQPQGSTPLTAAPSPHHRYPLGAAADLRRGLRASGRGYSSAFASAVSMAAARSAAATPRGSLPFGQ